jgi:REP element-mobilizing transposase RayT
MALPRSKYVRDGEEGVYHCFSRCVRRAFLYGFDAFTNRDFSHRKAWLVDRLHFLATIFAIEVCAYSIMENHYHSILRTRPDIVAGWSDWEVASRWLTLFPKHPKLKGALIPIEEQIRALADCPERIAQLRKRLCSLSWFLGRLNEFIARAANKEDQVKGRFWESRFKCQGLLDDAAVAACMVYVDLNPIRAGLAATPEESDFTSIQERIRAWQEEMTAAASIPPNAAQDIPSRSLRKDAPCWLCPISSESQRAGILHMTAAEYFNLVDQSGRLLRPDKRGGIDAGLKPILLRIGANPDAWVDTISQFGRNFHLAAGLLPNLRNFAHQLGKRWFTGVRAAKTAFVLSPSQLA